MGIGTSLFLIAAGAVLRFAVSAEVAGIDLQTVGTILMVVGVVGLLLSLLWLARGRSAATVERERVVTRDDPYAPRVGERVVEHDRAV